MNSGQKTLALLLGCLLLPAVLVVVWLRSAAADLASASDAADEVAIASASEDQYCSPTLKKVLRRVAGACGLIEGGGRGCKPADAKAVAALSGNDFNTLFVPLSHRAGIVQFDSEQVELDEGAKKLVESAWSEQRGASFFFVVARASPEGDTEYNQQLSQKRAEAVLSHLETHFKDPEIKGLVGLLWLGEEFAQLDEKFCSWKRSREGECKRTDINRSAFVAWIDCAI
jgi:outer membrane protein OmpA-like peptidoglycan-associated protein